jgi:hypothetical protein
MVVLSVYECLECGKTFDLCGGCYRNQKCCSDWCRMERSLRCHRVVNGVYSRTTAGRESNQVRQQRSRDRRSSGAEIGEETASFEAPRNGCNSLPWQSQRDQDLACEVSFQTAGPGFSDRQEGSFVLLAGWRRGHCCGCGRIGWKRQRE